MAAGPSPPPPGPGAHPTPRPELRVIYTPQLGTHLGREPRPLAGEAPPWLSPRACKRRRELGEASVWAQGRMCTRRGQVLWGLGRPPDSAGSGGGPPSGPPAQSLIHLSRGQAGDELASKSSPGPLGVIGSAEQPPTPAPTYYLSDSGTQPL